MEIRDWVLVAQGIALPLMIYIASVCRAVRNELRVMNGRLIKMETWSTSHDKLDDERHTRFASDIHELKRR